MNYEAIRSVIARSCLALDREDYRSYLNLCSDDFCYRIVAFSKEIRREMVWLDVDRKALGDIFDMIPRHARMEGTLKRHVSVCTIEPASDNRANVVSSIMVAATSPVGASQLYAVGQLEDELDLSQDPPRLSRRQVRLETRVLAPHSHIPI